LAKNVLILAENLQRGKDKSINVTYLSSISQNKIIDLIDETAKNNLKY